MGGRLPLALTVAGMAAGSGILASAFAPRASAPSSPQLVLQDLHSAQAAVPYAAQDAAAPDSPAPIGDQPPVASGAYATAAPTPAQAQGAAPSSAAGASAEQVGDDGDPYRKPFDGQDAGDGSADGGAVAPKLKDASTSASLAPAGAAESAQSWTPGRIGISAAPQPTVSSVGGAAAQTPETFRDAPISAPRTAQLPVVQQPMIAAPSIRAVPPPDAAGTAPQDTPGTSPDAVVPLAAAPAVPAAEDAGVHGPSGAVLPPPPAAAAKTASGLIARVRAAAVKVAQQIRATGGYRFDGYNDCYGFVRRVWDPILSSLGQAPLPIADAPDPAWAPITSFAALIPGDVLATAQGHAWGADWHGGLFAGMVNGTPYIFDNSGSLGPSVRPHPPGLFRFYYRRTHALLAASR